MSVEKQEIEVQASRRFDKALKKLTDEMLDVVDDQVDLIIDNPEIGERKKGDLNYLQVHKFKHEGQEWLLGYSFDEGHLVLSLLQLGSHENYYSEAKKKRKVDLKLIQP